MYHHMPVTFRMINSPSCKPAEVYHVFHSRCPCSVAQSAQGAFELKIMQDRLGGRAMVLCRAGWRVSPEGLQQILQMLMVQHEKEA